MAKERANRTNEPFFRDLRWIPVQISYPANREFRLTEQGIGGENAGKQARFPSKTRDSIAIFRDRISITRDPISISRD